MLRACSFFTNKQHCKHSAEASRTPQSLRGNSSFSQRGALKLVFVVISLSISYNIGEKSLAPDSNNR